jgi:hypothetical protein
LSAQPEIHVRTVRVADKGRWEFREQGITWQPPDRYTLSSKFDPMPCYPHDEGAARKASADAARACPPLWPVDLWLADREEMARTNGHSCIDEGHYEGSEWVRDRRGFIMLSGKRTPPHPAVTRYLVGHEYGHNVAYMLNGLRDDGKHVASTAGLEREYAEARGLPEDSVHHGEGGTWHDSCAEILACDFRVLVLDMETEFWPHPGIRRPEEILAVRAWWLNALVNLERAREEAAAEVLAAEAAGQSQAAVASE